MSWHRISNPCWDQSSLNALFCIIFHQGRGIWMVTGSDISTFFLLPDAPVWQLLSQRPSSNTLWKQQLRLQLLICHINPDWPCLLFPTLCVWPFIGDMASDDEYLEIPSISRQRAGTYECTAVNDIDTDVQTVDITVNCESSTLADEWTLEVFK